jgi:anti-sigma regulatory factor (Ser/Thr protein kinase)
MESILSTVQDFSIVAADASHVAAARAAAQRMARALGFDETRAGRVSIVVTEAVGNMLKHAAGGTLAVRSLAQGEALGIEILAIDSGPGMASVAESSRDGVSTTGTPGTGLGAMKRLAEEFEIYSRPGAGTIVRMMLWDRAAPAGPAGHRVGAINVPKPGETVSGDAWDVVFHAHGATFLLADGLGHGPEAHRAAVAAVDALHRHPDASAQRILDTAHGKLRPTRGAAVAVMRHEVPSGEVAFTGVGNISAVILRADGRQAMVSHSGIVGHNVHKSQEYRYPWPKGALMVAHSDGLESRWDVAAYPGLLDCHPSVIAALLYRQHSRRRDDCTVVVARSLQ